MLCKHRSRFGVHYPLARFEKAARIFEAGEHNSLSEISSDRKHRIFVSYSRSKLAVAESLAVALEQRGFEVVLDRHDLPYGEEWQKVLFDLIRDSDTVLFLLCERAVSSRWCMWELQQVTGLKKRLVPI